MVAGARGRGLRASGAKPKKAGRDAEERRGVLIAETEDNMRKKSTK